MQDKEKRDPNRKWFHGSVWHYDFVRGANKKSYGLHVNIFQLCLIIYGTDSPLFAPAADEAGASRSKGGASPKGKSKAATTGAL